VPGAARVRRIAPRRRCSLSVDAIPPRGPAPSLGPPRPPPAADDPVLR
jgi:hypothetical protein